MNCLDHETSIKCEKNVTLKTSQSQVAVVICSCLFEVQKIGKKENLLLLFTKSVKRTKKNSKQKLSPGRPTQFKPQTQLNHCLFRSWSFMSQDSGI